MKYIFCFVALMGLTSCNMKFKYACDYQSQMEYPYERVLAADPE